MAHSVCANSSGLVSGITVNTLPELLHRSNNNNTATGQKHRTRPPTYTEAAWEAWHQSSHGEGKGLPRLPPTPAQQPTTTGVPRQHGHKGTKKSPLQKILKGDSLCKRRQLPTLPHCIAVPSAMTGLTSLFGMGRGGTPPL